MKRSKRNDFCIREGGSISPLVFRTRVVLGVNSTDPTFGVDGVPLQIYVILELLAYC